MEKITNIFLIRHSEQLRIKNCCDTSQLANEKIILSVEGEKKAEQLSQLKQLKNIDTLWCSNYARAIATAKYISNNNKIDINIDSNFNERKLRKFSKLTKS